MRLSFLSVGYVHPTFCATPGREVEDSAGKGERCPCASLPSWIFDVVRPCLHTRTRPRRLLEVECYPWGEGWVSGRGPTADCLPSPRDVPPLGLRGIAEHSTPASTSTSAPQGCYVRRPRPPLKVVMCRLHR